jgi:hypothetical protein
MKTDKTEKRVTSPDGWIVVVEQNAQLGYMATIQGLLGTMVTDERVPLCSGFGQTPDEAIGRLADALASTLARMTDNVRSVIGKEIPRA